MKIHCKTLFDCTATGVTGVFRPTRLPFDDTQGTAIVDIDTWARSRNKQRNWETLLQVIGLRTQPQNLTQPRNIDQVWHFEFDIEDPSVYGQPNTANQFSELISDCEGVPMVVGLDESDLILNQLCTEGPNQNIWFSINT